MPELTILWAPIETEKSNYSIEQILAKYSLNYNQVLISYLQGGETVVKRFKLF